MLTVNCAHCKASMYAGKPGEVQFCWICGWGNKFRYNKLTGEMSTRIVTPEEAEAAEWDEG